MGPNIGDKQEIARKLAEELLGTCDDLPEEILDDPDICAMLDNQVRQCDTCGWWVETHEINDDEVCDQCWEEEHGSKYCKD